MAAAADEVSAAVAAVFSEFGVQYEAAAGQAAAFHAQLVVSLQAAAGSYGAAEALNARWRVRPPIRSSCFCRGR
ncbi:PE domain-containing protein [Mycobacterium sp. ML4]